MKKEVKFQILLLFLFRTQAKRYGPDEWSRLLEENDLGTDSDDGDPVFDFSDESDGEEERIHIDDHSSDSELSGDEYPATSMTDDETNIYLGKDNETFWISNCLALPKSKTKSKNIIKTLPGPTRVARDTPTELDSFLKFITVEMIDKIVEYTNFYIRERLGKIKEKYRKSGSEFFRDRDFKDTSRTEIMALFGLLYILCLSKSNRQRQRDLGKQMVQE